MSIYRPLSRAAGGGSIQATVTPLELDRRRRDAEEAHDAAVAVFNIERVAEHLAAIGWDPSAELKVLWDIASDADATARSRISAVEALQRIRYEAMRLGGQIAELSAREVRRETTEDTAITRTLQALQTTLRRTPGLSKEITCHEGHDDPEEYYDLEEDDPTLEAVPVYVSADTAHGGNACTDALSDERES